MPPRKKRAAQKKTPSRKVATRRPRKRKVEADREPMTTTEVQTDTGVFIEETINATSPNPVPKPTPMPKPVPPAKKNMDISAANRGRRRK